MQEQSNKLYLARHHQKLPGLLSPIPPALPQFFCKRRAKQ